MCIITVPCSLDRGRKWSQMLSKALGLGWNPQLARGKIVQLMSLLPIFSRPVHLCTG